MAQETRAAHSLLRWGFGGGRVQYGREQEQEQEQVESERVTGLVENTGHWWCSLLGCCVVCWQCGLCGHGRAYEDAKISPEVLSLDYPRFRERLSE